MEQFKLRDIEEFDNDFKKIIDMKIADSAEKSINTPQIKSDESPEIFSGEEKFPLIEKDRQDLFDNVISDNSEYNESEDEAFKEVEFKKPKAPKGLVFCKSLSIILLCSTVFAFIIGCFISVFLDNNGLDVGGYCFNTQSQDIESLGVKKGDLIISKKVDINSVNSKDVICVPQMNGDGCDVQVVKNTYQNGPDEIINTIAFENGFTVEGAIQNELSYGLVKRYIPVLGKIINFAMNNAILVCALFVLIAALWCIVLILVEKKISEKNIALSDVSPITEK